MNASIPFFGKEISWFEIICTTIIPVSLFFLGLLFSRLVEKHKETLRYKRLEKYFFGLIDLLYLKNLHQIELLHEAAGRQDDFDSYKIMTDLSSGESHMLLKEIDRSELYNGFVLRKRKRLEERTKIFEKLATSLDFLYKFYLTLESNNSTLPIVADRYTQLWNNTQLELLNVLNQFKTYANINHITNDQLLNDIVKLQTDVESKVENKSIISNIEIGYNIYIDPLRILLYKYPRDPRVQILMDHVMTMR